MTRRERKTSGADAPQTTFVHGGAVLPLVQVDTYNEELRSPEGFIGDRASSRAFDAIVEDWRARLEAWGEDPFGDGDKVRKTLDAFLTDGRAEDVALAQSMIEEFAQEFAQVIRRFLKVKAWQGTEAIVVGGGLRKSRVGEVAIGRAALLLKAEGYGIELKPIRHHPDEAGLIGCVHLAPAWILEGHDAILAVDIGGSNIRAGIVALHAKKAPDLTRCAVADLDLWSYGKEATRPTRDEAVERLAAMLTRLIKAAAKRRLKLAPLVGIGCPGLIQADGAIEKGGQNLPGNWEAKRFNLPAALHARMPAIDGHASAFLMHNDAVAQGLSEAPFMREVERWGVMTIGTGLGNARFTTAGLSPTEEAKAAPKRKKTKNAAG